MAIAVLLIAPLAFASTLTVPQGGTGLTSVASGNILYGTGTNVLSSDSNATRVPGTLTNISDSFSSGDTSAFQLNPNFLGAGLAGVGLTQTAADGKAVVFSGDGTSTGQSDFANTIYSMDNSGSQGIVVVDGKTGTGTVSAQYQDGPISAVLGLNDGGSTVTYGNGSLVSGIAALPGQVLRLINGTVWNWPTTDGSNGQVLTTDGSGNLSFQTAGGGCPAGSDMDVSYNLSGACGGDGNFTWNYNTQSLAVGGTNAAFFVDNGTNDDVYAQATNGFVVQNQAGNQWFNANPASSNVALGDIDAVGNQTTINLSDGNNEIDFGGERAVHASNPAFTGSGLNDLSVANQPVGNLGDSYTVEVQTLDSHMYNASITGIAGGTFTDTTSGATATFQVYDFVNGHLLLDDSTIVGTISNGDNYTLSSGGHGTINADMGVSDTFSWTGPTIFLQYQQMSNPPTFPVNNIQISFGNSLGHTVFNFWTWSYVYQYGRMAMFNGSGDITLGDVDQVGNRTQLLVQDQSNTINAQAKEFSAGDLGDLGNSTKFSIDDSNSNSVFQAANGILAIDNGGNNYWTFDPNSGIFKYGLFNSGNYTNLAMNDSGESLTFHTGGNPSTGNVMTLTGGASTTDAAFGDLDHLGNDTIFDLNDSTQTITFGYGSSGSYTFPIGNATGVLTNDGSGNLSWAPAGGSSPFTIQNTNSIFSTGLTGLWTSNATDSFIEGDNASDNSSGSTLDSVTWIGDLAGASDGSQSFEAPRSDFIGNRAGYNAFNAQNSTFMGYLAGAYATDASYSVFMGAQAGEQATYAGNSFFFGQGAGDNATVAGDSIFMGLLSGENATNAGTSNFFGANSGNGATNANNSTFIGSYSGFNDTVNNQGLITYTGESAPFDPGQPITSTSGGAAVVISDDTSGNLVIIDSKGTFTPGDTITETNGGQTATLVTYTPSTSSILIGDNTTTGGGKNSVAIGANASNAGFNNSICIGVSCLNTDNDQYAWGDQITKWRFAGTSFSLPTVAPSGNGQFLAVGAGNQLSWAVPGASDGGLTVLAATLTTLPDSPTYSNGSSGVGATLSATSNGSLTVDGVAIPLNGRILVDDESNQTWNGVYRQSTLGDGSTAYVLTRTTDADTTTEFTDMVVSPSEGMQSSTAFGQQTATPTIGTDDIVFDSLSSIYLRQETSGTQAADQIPIYTGTGLTLTKGTSDFTYTPYSGGGGALDIDNTNQNDFIGGGIASATGFENAGFGNETLASLTSGSANTALGVNAGDTITSGQENTLIGTGSETATATTSGGIALGFDSVAASNEFSLAPAITNWKFQGDSYTLPTAFPTSSGNGIFESTTSGVMSWGNGQLPITIFTPTTGTTVNLVDNNYNAVNPSGAILALTVNFPSSPANGDVVEIKYDQGVTTITYSGGTVLGGTTTAALGAYAKFTFNGSTWY